MPSGTGSGSGSGSGVGSGSGFGSGFSVLLSLLSGKIMSSGWMNPSQQVSAAMHRKSAAILFIFRLC
jgi:hypothetical protein